MGYYEHNPKGKTLEPYYNHFRVVGTLSAPQSFCDIIIPNGGGLDMAKGSYEALRRTSDHLNIRIIPVSQGPCGANDYWIDISKRDERVFPVLNDRNMPVPNCYTSGYVTSMRFKDPSPYIFTLDDDSRLDLPDWLDYLVWLERSYNKKGPKVGLTAYSTAGIGRTAPKDGPWVSEVDVGWDCNLIRRDAFDDVGLPDNSFIWHFGDSDYCRRLTLHRGWLIRLGKEPNKWRSHIGRMGSRQLGYAESWLRAISVELGMLKWSNMPVKGVYEELGVDKVRNVSYVYPKEGWWAEGKDFKVYAQHDLPSHLLDGERFPFTLLGRYDGNGDDDGLSILDVKKDINLVAYKEFRKKNEGMYDEAVKRFYGITGPIDVFLGDVPDSLSEVQF